MTDQFADFSRRKEREALEARLPPYATAFDARPPDALAIGNDWTRRLFDGDFYVSPPPDASRPACSLVFVQSADGNTGAQNPSSLGGGATDKHLIYEGLSRVAADAVMAGAETVRAGNIVFSVWHPELVRLRASLGQPRHPVQIVVTTARLDLERGMLFNVPEIRVVLLTVPARAGFRWTGARRRGRGSRRVVTGRRKRRSGWFRTAAGDGHRAHLVHRRPHAGDVSSSMRGWCRTSI